MTHLCIKPTCRSQYESDDLDAYYCPPCNQERKAIAKEIDQRIASRPKKVIQSFATLQQLGQTKQSASGGMATFFRASDLGL